MWDHFTSRVYNEAGGLTKVASFRDYLQQVLEERLTRLPDLGYEDPAPDRIRISMISFAFDNAALINLLRARGTCIKFENYDGMRALNVKINELKSTPEKVKAMNRPVTAFLTFENEEGVNRAKSYADTVQGDPALEDFKTFCGQPLVFEDTSEPTDIIWENRRFTAFDRIKRTIIVVLVVFLLLFCSFIIIFFCSRQAAKPVLVYPQSSAICAGLAADFTDKQLEGFSYRDYIYNEEINAGQPPAYSSYLPCFCNAQATAGAPSDQAYANPIDPTQTR